MDDSLELDHAVSPLDRFREQLASDEGDHGNRRCFQYQRGASSRVATLEFRRHRAGDSFALPYGWLGPHYFHPSYGIALVFAGPISYVVTIRGRHLNTPFRDVSLYESGILRQRVTWIAEAKPEALRLAVPASAAAGGDPCVVERIEIQAARSEEELWGLLAPWHDALLAAGSSS